MPAIVSESIKEKDHTCIECVQEICADQYRTCQSAEFRCRWAQQREGPREALYVPFVKVKGAQLAQCLTRVGTARRGKASGVSKENTQRVPSSVA